MDDQIPWTGGIGNRQILAETARGLAVWVAVSLSLSVLFWWIADGVPFAGPHWRAAICAGLAGAISAPIARWCRA